MDCSSDQLVNILALHCIAEGETWADDISSEEERRKEAERKAALEKRKSVAAAPDAKDGAVADAGEDDGEEEESEEEEVAPAAAAAPAAPAAPAFGMELDLGLDDDVIGEEEMLGEEEEVTKAITRTKRVKIPPIWIANNRRTHAALIYRFFRNQTTSFLPPDPPPEPPHIIMTFEAYKRDDVLNFIDSNKEEIPQYGFFTTDIPGDAKLITNSPFKYEELKEQNRTDRLVLKVNKVQSYTMLALVPFEPTYVSNNTVTGQQDSIKFFPEDYEVDEEIPEGAPIPRRKVTFHCHLNILLVVGSKHFHMILNSARRWQRHRQLKRKRNPQRQRQRKPPKRLQPARPLKLQELLKKLPS